MGNTYEVYSYVKDTSMTNAYSYVRVYRGESFLKALLVARKEKRKGVGCVKLEWR